MIGPENKEGKVPDNKGHSQTATLIKSKSGEGWVPCNYQPRKLSKKFANALGAFIPNYLKGPSKIYFGHHFLNDIR